MNSLQEPKVDRLRQGAAKGARPARPRANKVLDPSSKCLSRALVHVANTFEVGTTGTGAPDGCMLGFRKAYQCMDFISMVRSTLDKPRNGIIVCTYANYLFPVHAARSGLERPVQTSCPRTENADLPTGHDIVGMFCCAWCMADRAGVPWHRIEAGMQPFCVHTSMAHEKLGSGCESEVAVRGTRTRHERRFPPCWQRQTTCASVPQTWTSWRRWSRRAGESCADSTGARGPKCAERDHPRARWLLVSPPKSAPLAAPPQRLFASFWSPSPGRRRARRRVSLADPAGVCRLPCEAASLARMRSLVATSSGFAHGDRSGCRLERWKPALDVRAATSAFDSIAHDTQHAGVATEGRRVACLHQAHGETGGIPLARGQRPYLGRPVSHLVVAMGRPSDQVGNAARCVAARSGEERRVARLFSSHCSGRGIPADDRSTVQQVPSDARQSQMGRPTAGRCRQLHGRRYAMVPAAHNRDRWHLMEPGLVARVLRRTPKAVLLRSRCRVLDLKCFMSIKL